MMFVGEENVARGIVEAGKHGVGLTGGEHRDGLV